MVNSDVQQNGVSASNRPEPVEILLDDSDEEMPDITREVATSSNGLDVPTASTTKNGSSIEAAETPEATNPQKRAVSVVPSSNGVDALPATSSLPEVEAEKPVECIELDDDCVVVEPPAKRLKSEVPTEPVVESNSRKESPAPAPKKEVQQLTNYDALLDRLDEHVQKALTINDNVDRKLLDALLGAINVQVQKEPYSVRKLILDKQLVLPNSISFPPSQVVDLVIEHDADVQITRVINRMFGEERPKPASEQERRERQQLKATCPAPSMTRMLMDIGQELIQESTYSDIVHARNLPETPKNVDAYKQVAAKLKPVWHTLREKNASFKFKQHSCNICGYKTDNLVQYSIHKQTLHIDTKNAKIQCGMCPEFNTNGTRIHKHYLEEHQLVPLTPEDPPVKIQCAICDEDFQFKGHRDAHFKSCKRDVQRVNTLQASRMPEHSAVINRWLWPRPPPDPSIQQDIQKAQQAKQQQQQQLIQQQQRQQQERFARLAANAQQSSPQITPAAIAAALKNHHQSGATAALLAQRQLQDQLKNLNPAAKQQMESVLRGSGAQTLPPAVVQAIQAQLQKLKPNNATANAIAQLTRQLTPQAIQQLQHAIQEQQKSQQGRRSAPSASTVAAALAAAQLANQSQRKVGSTLPGVSSSAGRGGSTVNARTTQLPAESMICEICDEKYPNKREYMAHLQQQHHQFRNKSTIDLDAGPPLACSRCRDRFWSYDGLERHLVMEHYLVTSDLLAKAQKKGDSGRCKICKKSFAFNMLQHLATDHNARLCSAEIMFSCDVCPFKCASYQKLEEHLNVSHPKNGTAR